jgi:ferrous-iron efflux pump FieF
VRPLVDERLPAEEEALVRTALNGEAGVRGYHKLRSRRAGSHRLIDVHVLMDDDLTFRAAHALAETVERRIRQALPNADVIVHAEPWEEEMEHQETHHR